MSRGQKEFAEYAGLVLTCIAMLGGFWVYCEGHFASAESVQHETESRKDLKGDIIERLDRIENKVDHLRIGRKQFGQ